MALIEKSGILKFVDAAGQMYLLYPITTTEQVDGMDAVKKEISDEATRAKAAEQVNATAADNANTAAKNAADAAAANTRALNGCWIEFTDEDGNPTDEPYIHWLQEV